MFFAFVRCLCRWHKVPFRKCVWALRQESGEISGRLHFHFLISGSCNDKDEGLLCLFWTFDMSKPVESLRRYTERFRLATQLAPRTRDIHPLRL